MGCDEPISALVLNALLDQRYQDWLGAQVASRAERVAGQATPSAAPARKRGSPARAAKKSGKAVAANAAKPPSSRRTAINDAMVQALDKRLQDWLALGQSVQAGNLGEQVALRVLEREKYEVLVTQQLMKDGIEAIVGGPTRMNAEDFLVVKDNRLISVNSKAVYSERSSKVLADGNLGSPRISREQRAPSYAKKRADLFSPLEGDPYSLVIEVDLVAKLAQFFEIADDLTKVRVGEPISVLEDIVAVCARHPGDMPAPYAGKDAALGDEQP